MNHLERFLKVMAYEPVDRVPNWEVGIWPQTKARWEDEGLDSTQLHGNWFAGESALGFDPREFIHYSGGMLPAFEREVLDEDDETETFRDGNGRVRRALKAGTVGGGRVSMDTFLEFPVHCLADWQKLKHRFDPTLTRRYEPNWRDLRVAGWACRQHPLIFGENCATLGFYWLARDLMGTEGLSYAWYDQPELMHDIMGFWGEFLIEAARPILETTTVEYVCFSEDMSMKTGPLLSPDTYRQFIYPHFKRVNDFLKARGVRYICVDTDGNPEALIPLLLDAGVDVLWPLERAADQDPVRLRRVFGKSLRLWGGVDKRELTKDPEAIDVHLRAMQPLVDEGGFIPTVDHTVPHDVSWPNFQHYLAAKEKLLRGKL